MGRLAVLFVSLCLVAVAFVRAAAVPHTSAEPATPEAVPAILQAWADAYSSHHAEQSVGVYTDDVFYEDLAFGFTFHSKADVESANKAFFEKVPDAKITLKGGFVAGDEAVAEWIFSGTNEGGFLGVPGNGKKFKVRAVSVFELIGGKIHRQTDYYNLITIINALNG